MEASVKQLIDQISGSGWKVQKRALVMTKRYDYANYDDMRDFLDDLQELSEKDGFYPDLTFSRTHANVSIKSREDDKFTEVDFDFPKKVDLLAKKAITVIEGG
ncbi:4a-hydroxytetrahydrobiopterin dehydratase [Candidatus Thioglobus sp.]|nr:4a-hydroxytetrahydrobiopterin dehydratase [Candidatus Thioglobus sp.]MDB3893680.1 4a-hydroxytetrahydrobiopterin dehydratase [Candidatus Thioglobus sp.]MDC0388533.1 4a-hydroxytetrahydrobiopterin dehydratase [Candidatus Thioglobus sp.]MDC0965905.1 4a-hydroxytetrahydrobiopterin dehydratase [Candidatus Thioglobus sp.]